MGENRSGSGKNQSLNGSLIFFLQQAQNTVMIKNRSKKQLAENCLYYKRDGLIYDNACEQESKRIWNIRFDMNADKHSPASSARSTKRWVRGMLMSVGVESSH